ncbi:CbiX/SirB N-terminal domain-containing protein, partial [Saccharopolyspora sp. NPDC002686]|uniref:sirohydrochlorin chelatase n=1 Tax=Saccharopolyspora sp. NPDC002686 TaxID=3154541 RepID=UPI003329803E
AAFLDLSAPRLGDVLSAVHGDGHDTAVVVPLLLGRAFHARVDVPAAVAETQRRHPLLQVQVTDVLGPDPRLEAAAWRRLLEAGADPDDPNLGVLVAGAGSSHAPANQLVANVAERWQAKTAWAGAAATFASAAEPAVPAAIERLRARGARRIAVASWFLAPGRLPDRITDLTHDHAQNPLIATPMANAHEVADLILTRYTETLATTQTPHRLPAVL